MFSDLLTDRSVGLVAAPVIQKTARDCFPFSEAGRSPRFTGKMLRNNLTDYSSPFLKEDSGGFYEIGDFS
jgi:hypothetical protein